MTELITRAKQLLGDAGYSVMALDTSETTFIFEDRTVIGFAIEFGTPEEIVETWRDRLAAMTAMCQIALRRSRDKSWNTYAVLLCEAEASEGQKIVLQSVEEDLTGTRKIVRSGLPDNLSLTQALLPLLPLQGAPELPVVNMEEEIRSRTKEISDGALKAFFSQASEVIALQVIEETP